MVIKTINTLSGKIKLKIPTDLSEITLDQMIKMQSITENDNSIPLIPGLDRETVDNIIDYEQLIDIRERVLSLAHQIQYCYNETKIPEFVIFGTKKVKRFGFYFNSPNKVKVISNLSIEPAGALFASRDLIAEERMRHIKEFGDDWEANFTPNLECCAGILANYFYCHATGNLWNESKVELFKAEILQLPISIALPIARFFFLKYPSLSKSKMKLWQIIQVIWKKKRALFHLKNSHIGM